MAILSGLKLSDQTRTKSIAAPEVKRREKLLINIERQIKAAEAYSKGDLYTYKEQRYVTHAQTGKRTRQSVSVKVKQWWWKDMAGTYFLCIKYGNRKLELSRGMTTIKVGRVEELIPTLEKIVEAVKVGEFDEMLSTVGQ